MNDEANGHQPSEQSPDPGTPATSADPNWQAPEATYGYTAQHQPYNQEQVDPQGYGQQGYDPPGYHAAPQQGYSQHGYEPPTEQGYPGGDQPYGWYQHQPQQQYPYWAAGGAGTPPGGPPHRAGAGGQWPNGPYGRQPKARGVRTAVAAAAVIVAVAAGVAVGHAAWPSKTSPSNAAALAPSGSSGSGSNGYGSSGSGSGSLQLPSGSGGFGSGSGGFGSGSSGSGSNGTGSSGGGSNSSAQGSPSDVSAIAAKVSPGLVDINVSISYANEEAAGTGMVLTSNGEVLTNNHVIDGATSISVTDIANGKTYSATVAGYDRADDVAVLQLQKASGLQTVTLGDSSKVSVGQAVVGIGNAGGTGGTPSAAGGAITALNQSITASDDGSGTSEQLSGLIGTDANIQPGDSGGPLVNASGQVIGIDTAGSSSDGSGFGGFSGGSGSEGSSVTDGYAIPINTAMSIAKSIEAGKASDTIHVGATAFIGVEFKASSSGSGLGGGFGGSSGASVAATVSGSPAEAAGLVPGDTITSFDGKSVSSSSDLATLLVPHKPGDKVQMTYTDQSGQSHTVTVTLSSGPPA